MFGNLLSGWADTGVNILSAGTALVLGERDKDRAYALEKKRLDIQAFQQQRETEKAAAEAATGSQLTNIMRIGAFSLMALILAWVGVSIARKVF